MLATSDQSPAVSVIVPVYKTEQYLSECLESVARQSFTDWECIIVDDGSDSPEFIEHLARKTLGDRAKVIHQTNRGLSAARNAGITAARGGLIACLDSDDYLHPDFLAKTAAALHASHHADIIFCWTQHVGQRQDLFKPSAVQLFWLLQRNLISVTALFKKDIVKTIGGFDETMKTGHEDWEFWIRASLAGYQFKGVPLPLFYYRILPDSMVVQATKNRADTIHYIRHKHASVYFMPLSRLFSYAAFSGIPEDAIVRFWLTGIFFHYLPPGLRRALFALYQKWCDG